MEASVQNIDTLIQNTGLPVEFIKKMEKLLDAESFQQLLDTYQNDQQRYKGIRCNTLKCSVEDMKKRLPFDTESVPWCPTGSYIDASIRPGKNPAYYAGLYYVQEPTAMIPAEILDPQPGDWVLDLCAAPGGKTTQLACKMKGKGLLAANELIVNRASILAQNVERMGIPNAILFNDFPEHFVGQFYEAFDKILVDAPCSGEGMFRKEPLALEGWSPENVQRCAERQKKILESVDKLLKPGGILVYSTCTFSPEEDECIIEELLASGRYKTEKIILEGLNDYGHPEWTKNGTQAVSDTLRVMPFHVKGEGHYIARLQKNVSGEWNGNRNQKPGKKNKNNQAGLKKASKADLKYFYEFRERYLHDIDFIEDKEKNLYLFEEHLYALPKEIDPGRLSGCHVLRAGLHLGDLLKNRFEPAHAFAMALKAEQFVQISDLTDDEQANRYLKGEPLTASGQKGWTLVCWHGYPLGFGKSDGNIIKNHYPKGLRIRKK